MEAVYCLVPARITSNRVFYWEFTVNELETELRKMECGDVVVAEASGSSYERVPGGWLMDGAVFVPGRRVVVAVNRGAPLVEGEAVGA